VKALHRVLPAVAIAALMLIASVGQSETLILKRADGSTITTFPLSTSHPLCTVTSAGDIEVWPQSDNACTGGTPPTAPTFPTPLNITPAVIAVGGTVTATWASAGATSCSNAGTILPNGASVGNWSASLPPTSSGLVMTLGTVGSYTFVIACTNATGTTTSQKLVTVNDGGACSGVVPIGGLTRQTSFNNTTALQLNTELGNGPVTATDYLAIFGNGSTTFPSRSSGGTLAVMPGKFIALQFNTGTLNSANYGVGPPNPNRFGNFGYSTAGANNGDPLVAISLCPGDFSNTLNPAGLCRIQAGEGATPIWGVNSTDPLLCQLAENTVYYLNVAYVNFANPTASTCANPDQGTANPGSCHWFMSPR